MFLLLYRPAFNLTIEHDKSDKIQLDSTQHNILSHSLVNTRLGQDTTLKAFPKPQHYKGSSLINYFLLYLRLTEKKTMLVYFAE